MACGWAQEELSTGNDDFDWAYGQGSTVVFGTGPSVDHTLGTGKGE